MSVSNGKKRISQDELRRFMSEQKRLKLTQGTKKIESPLAKYNASGQLTCIICESVVRSEAVWSIHLNSKQHKENIAKLKKKKDNDRPIELPPKVSVAVKRPLTTVPVAPEPAKKIKSILKNPLPIATPQVPTIDACSTSAGISNLKLVEASDSENEEEEQQQTEGDTPKTVTITDQSANETAVHEEPLPEGFFDDPVLDAKARHVEYKDPKEEEWEKFQKAIMEETTVSAQIIAEDETEAAAERIIDEIDEQMVYWSRFIDLKNKQEQLTQIANKKTGENGDDLSSSGDEIEFDDDIDWRAKRAYK